VRKNKHIRKLEKRIAELEERISNLEHRSSAWWYWYPGWSYTPKTNEAVFITEGSDSTDEYSTNSFLYPYRETTV
jgi:hypothetical protein